MQKRKRIDIFKRNKIEKAEAYNKIFGPNGTYHTKDYLDDMVSPLIQGQFKMQYNGAYTWYGSWNQHMRKVISIFLLKGDSGIFKWGYNFDFLPEFMSGRFQYFRTEKSVKAQLRDLPKTFIDFENWGDYLIPMNADDLKCLENRITDVWEITQPSISDWFERVNSLEAALAELEYQISYQKYYKMFVPEQTYIKAFLTAAMGDEKRGIEILKETSTYKEAGSINQEKLVAKIKGLSVF